MERSTVIIQSDSDFAEGHLFYVFLGKKGQMDAV